jgi:glutamate synthase (NADPH) small chain
MDDANNSEVEARLAWRLLTRVDPPKRPAAERAKDFFEISGRLDEATARRQASRCIQCPEASCKVGCPLANHIPEWLALTAEGRFLEAAELSRATSNMPEICARICPQEKLCEGACILNGKAEPVAIGAIEQFINEYAFARDAVRPVRVPPNGKCVAVVGSGPAGLSCADELARFGYAVTVFEAQQLPGGLLVNGIPAFKLEKHVVQRRIDLLKRSGVEFRLGMRVGEAIDLSYLRAHYDAVFLGIGAMKAKPLDIPGAHLPGVWQGMPFLIEKNVPGSNETPAIEVAGKQVVVLGGGDTAMDCLRTALRCRAARVTCLYRRDLVNMPGARKEYISAVEEGAQFRFLANPIVLLDDCHGAVRAVRCEQMELGAPDAGGRRQPRSVPNSEFEVPADLVLVAYGFDPVPFPPDSELSQIKVHPWGGFVVDRNQMTNIPGVFAGGDLVRGASLVVHAVRDARKAAQAIHDYLARKLEESPERELAVSAGR